MKTPLSSLPFPRLFSLRFHVKYPLYFILFFSCYFGHSAFAQTKIWDKKFGGPSQDNLSTTIKTNDGGYLLGGFTGSGSGEDKSEASRGGDDYWIVKLDSTGKKQWDKTFGGNRNDVLQAMIANSDGSYLLGGYSNSDKSNDKSAVNKGGKDEFGNFTADFWLVKIDATGTKLWDKTIGGNGSDRLNDMVAAPGGGFLLGGSSDSDKSGDKSEDVKDIAETQYSPSDFWVVKIDENGAKVWDKAYTGIARDGLTALVASPDGGYLLGGFGGISDCANRECSGFWIIKITATGQQQWDRKIGITYGDSPSSILNTADGGYLLGGNVASESFSESNFLVAKIDALGNPIWIKTYDDKGDIEGLNAMTPASGGGYFLGGWTGGGSSWLVKINENGTKLWDGTIEGLEEIRTLNALPDNNYVLGGGFQDYQLIKIKWEPQPATLDWDKSFGGIGRDNLTTTIQTTDGGYLAGGYTNANYGNITQKDLGKNNYWIVKTDPNGQGLWSKSYGGPNDDYLNRVIQTRDGGYLLAGSSLSGKSGDKTQASQGGRDYWVIKVDAQGKKQWDQRYGGTGSDELLKVVQLATGEYILGGHSNSPGNGDKSQASQGGLDYWLVKISSTGTKIWDKRYGGSLDETLGSFTATRDGGFLLGGTSLSGKSGDKTQSTQGGRDYWVVKTDKDGNLVWEKTYGSLGQDEVYSVGRSHGDNLFIAGTSNSGKNGNKSQASQGGKDYWLLKLDKNGTKIWDKTFGGNQDDELRASAFTDQGHYVLAGSSSSSISGDKTQASQGASDYWVVEVDEKGDKVQDQRFGGSGTEELRTVTQIQDGGLLLGGRSDSEVSGDKTQYSGESTDYWLVKIYPATSSLVAARTGTLAEEVTSTPTVLSTFNAFPNPFQERITIRFTLPATQPTTLKVLDNQGHLLATLFQEEAQANQTYQVEWQAGKQPAGLYFLQLQTPTLQQQQKLLLSK